MMGFWLWSLKRVAESRRISSLPQVAPQHSLRTGRPSLLQGQHVLGLSHLSTGHPGLPDWNVCPWHAAEAR